jgi:nucleoside-diphosphate-sugar epimerase
MSRPLAALTGASGFLGRHIGGALEAGGYRVRILARAEPGAQAGLEAASELVVGRLDDEEALAVLVRGCEVVVHAAGLIKARRRQDFTRVNVEGSRRLAQAAARHAPDARIVLVSSLTAREPLLSAYAASKRAAEDAMRQALAPEHLTIVRPPAIYGPGDRETLALFRAVKTLPLTPLPGSDRARLALIHVADAARQIAALAQTAASGTTWALADARPQGYGWKEIMAAAGEALERRTAFVQLPASAVLALGAVSASLGRLGGGTPIFTLGKARELLHPDWSVSPSDLAPDRPPPRFDLALGFADTVAWYRAQGWL